MTNDKTIKLLELKAEVLRRKQEAEAARAVQLSTGLKDSIISKSKTTPILSGNSSKTSIPEKRSISYEEAEAWEKSQEALERKTRLYDQIQRGDVDIASINSKGDMMVDFDRKGWDETTKEYVGIPEEPHYSNPFEFLSKLYKVVEEENLIEYIDEFGRSRLINPREKHRLDAEREENERLLKETCINSELLERVVPTHFDADKEIRTKGIGFFKFSRDEDERKRQLGALEQVRKNTKEERAKMLLQKEERRLRLESRLMRIEDRRKKFNIQPESIVKIVSEGFKDDYDENYSANFM